MGELGPLAIGAVVTIVAVSAFEKRLGVAAPVLLVLVGIGFSFVPSIPHLTLEPELVLQVLLPPLLYAAAVNMPVTDFRRNLGSIGVLSVVLVIVSAVACGFVLDLLVPGLGLPAGIALGAVVSPPDAVAATAIGKRLGLPPRLVTILEGEGLVNDATALVLLSTAVAATTGVFSFASALGTFAYAVIVAVVVGLVVGLVSVWVRSRLEQPVLTTAISFVVPFVAFLPAEEMGASGVLAVVVVGLVTGARSPRHLSAQDRLSERTNWRTLQLLLENGVFLVMGFQITDVVAEVPQDGGDLTLWTTVGIGLALVALLGVVRLAVVVPLVLLLRRSTRRGKAQVHEIGDMLDRLDEDEELRTHPRAERLATMLRRRQADASFYARQGLGWRGGAVLAWSGMRGVVTLAGAETLPTDFPYRAQLVLIAFTVAIVTLVGQGGTLPALIRALGIRGSDQETRARELALLHDELTEAGLAVLKNPDLRRPDGSRFDPVLVDKVRVRRAAIRASMTAPARFEPDSPARQLGELESILLAAEEAALHDARSEGSYTSATIAAAQRRIDESQVRLDGQAARLSI